MASLHGWTFDIRDGWVSGHTTPPSLVPPSGKGLIQMSFFELKSEATPDFLRTAARTAMEAAGASDAPLGKPLAVPTGELFVGGRGRMGTDAWISVMVGGKGTSAVTMTFIHDGREPQEQADAEATLVSARLVAATDRVGFLKRFGRG